MRVRSELDGVEYDARDVVFVRAGHLIRSTLEAERMVRICATNVGGEAWAPAAGAGRMEPWIPVTLL